MCKMCKFNFLHWIFHAFLPCFYVFEIDFTNKGSTLKIKIGMSATFVTKNITCMEDSD